MLLHVLSILYLNTYCYDFFVKLAELSACISDVYNDVDDLRDAILSYPLDATDEIIDLRRRIASQLKYALYELSDAYQIFCDLKKDIIELHEKEFNVEFKPIGHENN